MVITSSNVAMAAATTKKVSTSVTHEMYGRNLTAGTKEYQRNLTQFSDEFATYEKFSSEKEQKDADQMEGCDGVDSLHSGKTKSMDDSFCDPILTDHRKLLNMLRDYFEEMRKRLFELWMGKSSFYSADTSGGNVLDLSTTGEAGSANTQTVWNRVYRDTYRYEESQSYEFATTGHVVTADGREIEFDLSLSMTEEYAAELDCVFESTEVIMTDPLVIQLGSNPVSVSPQKWQFDVDGDGKKDSISLLSEGAGFLVYDENEDGIINNGFEMFGAKTGNGFAELAAYDEDHNGWIDEQDSIYEKLKVWTKDETGSDEMLSLKKAGVGAIYLGSVASEYALNNEDSHEQLAQLRRSGMYLTERGIANSVVQLDMVKALIS